MLKSNLLNNSEDYNKEEIKTMVKSMRNDNICIDDIATLNNISVREVVDILEL